MSYNSDGLMSKDTIINILKKIGKTTVQTIKYKKFKAQNSVNEDYVFEYIFVCKLKK